MNKVFPSCNFEPLVVGSLPENALQNSCDPDHTTKIGMDIQFLAGGNSLLPTSRPSEADRICSQILGKQYVPNRQTAGPAALRNERTRPCI